MGVFEDRWFFLGGEQVDEEGDECKEEADGTEDETPDLRLETPAVETSLRRWSCQKKEKPDFSGFSANDGADLPAMNVCVWL